MICDICDTQLSSCVPALFIHFTECFYKFSSCLLPCCCCCFKMSFHQLTMSSCQGHDLPMTFFYFLAKRDFFFFFWGKFWLWNNSVSDNITFIISLTFPSTFGRHPGVHVSCVHCTRILASKPVIIIFFLRKENNNNKQS